MDQDMSLSLFDTVIDSNFSVKGQMEVTYLSEDYMFSQFVQVSWVSRLGSVLG